MYKRLNCVRRELGLLFVHFFLLRKQQSEYLGTLSADVLAVSSGEVPSSEEISVVDSITVD